MTAARSTATPPALADVSTDMPFESALEELEGIVRSLEKGDVPLDLSVTIYERGEALKRHCDALLRKAEARIQTISLGPDGRAAGTTPFDAG